LSPPASSASTTSNRQVAEALNEAGFAMLLFDLLTTEEELDRAKVFDIERTGSLATRRSSLAGADRNQDFPPDLAHPPAEGRQPDAVEDEADTDQDRQGWRSRCSGWR
jgi:hypothetical protein